MHIYSVKYRDIQKFLPHLNPVTVKICVKIFDLGRSAKDKVLDEV